MNYGIRPVCQNVEWSFCKLNNFVPVVNQLNARVSYQHTAQKMILALYSTTGGKTLVCAIEFIAAVNIYRHPMTSLVTRPNWPINNKLQHNLYLFVCIWCNQTHWNKHNKWLGKIFHDNNCDEVQLWLCQNLCVRASCWWVWVLCRGQSESSALSSLSCLKPPEEFVHFHNRCERRQLFFFSRHNFWKVTLGFFFYSSFHAKLW